MINSCNLLYHKSFFPVKKFFLRKNPKKIVRPAKNINVYLVLSFPSVYYK